MAYTTIKKPSDYFNTVLYTGDGTSSNAITGVGFQPDWIWIKKRNSTASHRLLDSIRGVQKHLASDNTDAEVTQNSVMSFDADGFTVGDSAGTNGSSDTFASWNWLASNTTASNTDGSITSTVSANTTSGFSISTFTTPASGTFTVGHGLGVAPKMIIYRPTGSSSWQVGHNSIGWTNFLTLNGTSGSSASTAFGNTAPTTSVWTGNTANVGANAFCVAYCFAEKKGFSRFGSYTGNENTNGSFVYLGFKPAWIIIKSSSIGGTAYDWSMFDNKRSSYNIERSELSANLSDAEDIDSTADIDFLSNGFKIRSSNANLNTSGQTYIYMAFAEEPLVGDNPATAR